MIQKLQELGFSDKSKNVEALLDADGDLDTALDILLGSNARENTHIPECHQIIRQAQLPNSADNEEEAQLLDLDKRDGLEDELEEAAAKRVLEHIPDRPRMG